MNRNRRRGSILAIAILTILATLALAPGVGATSPDRNGRIAFQAQTDHGVQIFTVRANGHDLRQLTHVDGDAAGPDWSPDGRRIAFSLNECSVAVMDADGDNLDVIASDPDLCQGDPSYTPDGSRLVYLRFDFALEVEEIWSMKTDGSDQRFVTDLGGADPNVSPDGRKLSFKGDPDGTPCSSPTSTAAGPFRSHRRSRSPTSTTGRRTASTSSSATTQIPRRMSPSTS